MKHRVLSIVASTFLLAAAAQAHANVFFSEYIEGTSFNKALEIYNGTGGVLDLADGGFALDIYINGSFAVGGTLALTGSVAAGDVYVIANSSASAPVLAQADLQTNSNVLNFNGDDTLVLRAGSTILDVFGQIGTDPGDFWGPPNTQNNTLVRLDTVFAGDTNGADAFDPALEWRGFGVDHFAELGSPILAAIPEPETYALLLAGLGLLGFAARRRRSGHVPA